MSVKAAFVPVNDPFAAWAGIVDAEPAGGSPPSPAAFTPVVVPPAWVPVSQPPNPPQPAEINQGPGPGDASPMDVFDPWATVLDAPMVDAPTVVAPIVQPPAAVVTPYVVTPSEKIVDNPAPLDPFDPWGMVVNSPVIVAPTGPAVPKVISAPTVSVTSPVVVSTVTKIIDVPAPIDAFDPYASVVKPSVITPTIKVIDVAETADETGQQATASPAGGLGLSPLVIGLGVVALGAFLLSRRGRR